MKTFNIILIAIIFSTLIKSCTTENYHNQETNSAKNKRYPVVREALMTKWNDDDNIDSPAFYLSRKGDAIIIATSKSNHNLFIYNAGNGNFINTFGKEGIGELEFKRPNGIWIIDDLLLVCERDNHRIQVISLLDFKFIGFLGTERLIYPYGLTVYKDRNGEYQLYVTDNFEGENDEAYPRRETFNKRIHHYSFTFDSISGNIDSRLVKTFGDTSGAGMLWIVESIYVDPVNNRLLIAEEDKNNHGIKIYDLEGNFTGQIIGDDEFEYQAEGIALFDCGNGDGFWFCTDQDYYLTNNNTFHIYDRKTLKYIGSFISEKTDNTDGIWLTQTSFGKFEKGALFAVHNDGGVGIFDIREIFKSLGINCK